MRKIEIVRLGVLLVILASNILSPADASNFLSPTSLCYQGEIEYFGCELQGSTKIISVCSANNVSPDSGYVQYRFGTHGNIEFKFPNELIPPRGKMSIVDVARFPDGVGSHLKFSNGVYTYVVSNALVSGEIYVAKGGKIVFDRICKGGMYIPFDNAARRGLEYGVVNSVDGLDHHGE